MGHRIVNKNHESFNYVLCMNEEMLSLCLLAYKDGNSEYTFIFAQTAVIF